MTRAMAALFVIVALGAGRAEAQGLQRNYGTSGYGSGGFGSTNPYNSNSNTNTRAATPATTTDQSTSTSSDYDRVMNSVNNSTAPALGKSTDDTTADPGADPNTDATQPSLPNANNGLNINRGASATGAGGLPGSNGAFTTPSGTVGLGAYNRSPYATGLGSGTTTNNAAPGPVTPTYTGQ